MRGRGLLCVLACVLVTVRGIPTEENQGNKISTVWRNCGSESDFVKVEHVKAFPHGRFVTVAIIGNLTEYIGDGEISVLQIKDDIIMDESKFCMCCRELDICPIPVGKMTFSRNLLVSPFVEEGSMATFQITVEVKSSLDSLGPDASPHFFDGRFKPRAFCVEVDVPIINQRSPLDYVKSNAMPHLFGPR